MINKEKEDNKEYERIIAKVIEAHTPDIFATGNLARTIIMFSAMINRAKNRVWCIFNGYNPNLLICNICCRLAAMDKEGKDVRLIFKNVNEEDIPSELQAISKCVESISDVDQTRDIIFIDNDYFCGEIDSQLNSYLVCYYNSNQELKSSVRSIIDMIDKVWNK